MNTHPPDDREPPYDRRAEEPAKRSWWGITVAPDINLGQILYILVSVSAALYVVSTYFSKVDNAQRDVKALQVQTQDLRLNMTSQFADMRAEVTKQIDLVRADIVALPDVRAQITMLDRSGVATNNRMDAQSTRLEQLQQTEIEDRSDIKSLRSDVDALKRAGENAPIRVPR